MRLICQLSTQACCEVIGYAPDAPGPAVLVTYSPGSRVYVVRLDGTGLFNGPFPLDLTLSMKVTPRTPTQIRTEDPLIKSQVQ